MKTSTFTWKSAALLLLTIGARTALADQGIAYAWIPSGSSPSISSTYSLNPSGGPISVSHGGTGIYNVTFTGSGIGTGWGVQATAYGSTANYCNVGGWGGSVITVDCYAPNGAAADTAFTVLAVASPAASTGVGNDKNIAFAWADQPTASGTYTPSTSYSYNPSGTISVTHNGTGSYSVVFNGLNGAGGTVQVTAYFGNASCYSGGWGGSFLANVDCVNAAGSPVDSYFVIYIIPAGVSPTGVAYVWADDDGAASYTPSTSYSYNYGGHDNGNDVTITRSSAGQYLVTFAGLAAPPVIGGNVRATSYVSTARCKVQSWGPGSASTFEVSVGCYNVSGTAVDAEYEVLVLPPTGYAYAWIFDTAGDVSPTYSLNPGGKPITASHNSTGNYTVNFPNSGIGTGWGVEANAYGGTANYCKVGSWGGGEVNVLCFNASGTAADSTFTVSAVSNTNGVGFAFAWASSPTTASYSPSIYYSYNPNGTIGITRAGAGDYTVTFNGLSGTSGTVQVTAYGGDNLHCWNDTHGGATLSVEVVCANPSLTREDSDFVIEVIPAGFSPSLVAWARADQSGAASYTPNAAYSYNPGGSITATRSGTGTYQITFAGFDSSQLTGGDVRVTSFDNVNRCKVGSWGNSGATFVANIACYTTGGSLADTQYQVLVIAPTLGAPAQISTNSGSSQSTYVTTAFGTALKAAVTDAASNPVANVTVTFTAPSSGASGTFPGGSLTATATTNSSGVATAPTFTANSTVGGPYNVTATAFGVTGNTTFSLTNLALIPITVTTSPVGLLVAVDGSAFTASPVVVNMVPGSLHNIQTETPQSGAAGVQYAWNHWSDSGVISHNISAPGSAFTFTAFFDTQFRLTTSASPSGGGTVSPASGNFYNSGTVVPISATANAGFTFNGWTGPVASPSSASTTVTMSAPETVTANFLGSTPITILTVPSGLQFNIDGGGLQTSPQTVSLAPGSHTIAVATTQSGGPGTQDLFTSWSDGGGASHSITVGASAATYTATFQTQYQLTIAASPGAGGTVSPASGTFYNSSTVVAISATANAGFAFNSWSGPVASPSSASTTVTMSAPETVTANFSASTGITIQTNPPGLQASVDGGAPFTAPQTLSLSPGTHTVSVVTTQTGGAGTQFVWVGWSDGGGATHSITVTGSPATFTATFNTQYLLTTVVSPGGAGSIAASPASAGFYSAGTSVQLTASANAGFTFTNWSGDLGGSANPQFITMNAPHSVTANFTSGSSTCSFTFSPPASLPPTGTSTPETCPNGSGQPNCGVLPETPASFTVTPSAACGPWTATSSNPAILQITPGSSSGNGVGAVAYILLNNTHTLPQTYTVNVSSGSSSANYTVTEGGSGDSEVYRQVYALYEQFLGRDPDAAGFAFWTGSGGAALGQMADAFLTSPEAFNVDFVVMAVYQAATGNPPTYAQYNAAATAIRAGTQTVPGLFNSLIPGGYTASSLYLNLLGRTPTASEITSANGAGLANWFQTLIGYPNSTTPVFTPNNEFQSTGTFHTTLAADHTNGLYVRMIYYVTLSRDPDPSGLAFWTGIANGGGPGLLFQGNAGFSTRIQILGPGTPNQGFIGSPEFQGLFAN